MISPSVHTFPKSGPPSWLVDGALLRAIEATRGVETPSGVLVPHYGCVGIVKGQSGSDRVRVRRITNKMWLGFDTYQALNDAVRDGKIISSPWIKNGSGYSRANVWGDWWPTDGLPPAGSYGGTANTARQFDNTTVGAIELRLKTPSGGTRHLVGRIIYGTTASSGVPELFWLYDRVLTYDGGGVSTVTTTLTNTLAAQRYIGSGDDGLQICITVSATMGVVASDLSSLTYTDNVGNTAQALAAGYTLPWYTSGPGGSTTALSPVAVPHDTTNTQTIAPFLPLLAGDSGVRKVEAFTSSVINTGTICVGLYKPLAMMWSPNAGSISAVEYGRVTFQLPQIFDAACLSMMGLSSRSNAASHIARIQVAHS